MRNSGHPYFPPEPEDDCGPLGPHHPHDHDRRHHRDDRDRRGDRLGWGAPEGFEDFGFGPDWDPTVHRGPRGGQRRGRGAWPESPQGPKPPMPPRHGGHPDHPECPDRPNRPERDRRDGGRGGRGPGRGRRGDVRAAVLALLTEQPMNGYQLITAIAEKSEGLWRPGAGSVYPALSLLEDEGLIAPRQEGSKKLYSLTEEGRLAVAEHAGERAPWERVTEPHKAILDLRPRLGQLAATLHHIAVGGDDAQIAEAQRILATAVDALDALATRQPDQKENQDD